jgi:uncharacterized protein YbaR (Trm112 family)
MHILLTDALTCPRCGPEYGLLLLADRTENRRVYEGTLGCMNCREKYMVRDGYADLTLGSDAVITQTEHVEPSVIAALMGITEGPALVALIGEIAGNAGEVADMISDLEVVAAHGALGAKAERPGVSRIGVGEFLPFRNACMKAVAVSGDATESMLRETARIAAVRARVVVFNGDESTAQVLEDCRLRVIARDPRATVAERTLF